MRDGVSLFEENVIEGMVHGRALAPLMERALQLVADQFSDMGHRISYAGPDHVLGFVGLPAGIKASRDIYDQPPVVQFVRYGASGFETLGEIDADGARAAVSDGCVSTCLEWYAGTRPFFIDGRIFVLMGYEMAEVRIDGV